jgi:hypothetical protein
MATRLAFPRITSGGVAVAADSPHHRLLLRRASRGRCDASSGRAPPVTVTAAALQDTANLTDGESAVETAG